MRAVVGRAYGGPEVLSMEELPRPKPREGEVLIDVRAIGINYPDLLVIRGEYQVKPPLPFSPGKEVAGIVAELGPGVTTCRPGDRVLAHLEYGGYSEQLAVREESCHVLPGGMSFAKAAGMGLAYQTAHFALFERGGYRPGETVLITGSAGAVGRAAVQLARAHGAKVLAGTRNRGQAASALANGADATVDLAAPGLRDSLREQVRAATRGTGADIVLDPVGGDVFDAGLRALAWRGRMVVIGFAAGRIPEVKANYLLVKNIAVSGLQWSDYRDREPARVRQVQRELFDLYAAGKLDPHVAGELPLEQFATALERVRSGTAGGKLVLVTG